ncbi:hypothetical protein [Pseudanabaena sp. UWO310]|uniref:hypothetical protein n=1 Tax=Pseudanabaena sp. UWO310 TaxID=2480795 RepID=UPI00115711F4|nr:hypothetical protein [Pseudanabaena sp. UWO310]TYQ30510.1 hypothetical protein PseudUWO310_08290 [Pseudanabaena sp. UWO310]
MANETRGILFETIAEVALRKAVAIAGIAGEVRWNQKPEGMSIIPDFTIGVDNTCLSHVVLVTASGSSKNTDMKSWRNLGELQEVKAQISTIPAVISLYFKSEFKKGLLTVGEALYDATLHIDRQPYFVEIEKWVLSLSQQGKITREEKQLLLDHAISSNLSLKQSIETLSEDLAQALTQRNASLDPLWHLMAEDYAKPHHPPTAKTTTLRRGLGKLLVLEPVLRQMVYAGYTKTTGIPSQHLPEYVFDLGFFTKTLGGGKLTDDEMKGAIELLGAEACEAVLQKAPAPMQPWINELRQLENIPKFLNFFTREFDQVSHPEKLTEMLLQCHRNPEEFAQKYEISFVGNLSRNWLFTTLMDLVKASTGKVQGFGYAQLSTEIGNSEHISSGYLTIADWANRVRNTELPTEVLQNVSNVLALKIRNMQKLKILSLQTQLIEATRKSVMEDRLIPYLNFQPLLWLLETELDKQGKPYAKKIPYEGWVNEYANVGKKSATTPFVKVGTTLIHWKSSYASHPNDKTKELSARARSIKYQYHPTTKTFSRRQGVDRLALIVDGDWKDNHLQTLTNSGWDIIVYPDEIASLVSRL